MNITVYGKGSKDMSCYCMFSLKILSLSTSVTLSSLRRKDPFGQATYFTGIITNFFVESVGDLTRGICQHSLRTIQFSRQCYLQLTVRDISITMVETPILEKNTDQKIAQSSRSVVFTVGQKQHISKIKYTYSKVFWMGKIVSEQSQMDERQF